MNKIKELSNKMFDLFVKTGGKMLDAFTLSKEWNRLAEAVDSVEVVYGKTDDDTLSL